MAPDLRRARAKAQARTASPKGGALASLKKRKAAQAVPEPETLGALGVHDNHDFMVNGVRYHSPRFLGRIHDRPWGSVDVTNGIRTYTLTNQFGSWMHPDADGYLKEPATLKLGSQLEVSTNLIARFDAFLKDMGIETSTEIRARRDAEEKAERKRLIEEGKRLEALEKAKAKPKGALARIKKK